jgi:hypothetical protein
MKIAILSDTHIEKPSPWFEDVFARYLDDADILVHCGDAVGVKMHEYMLQHPKLRQVAGNMDEWALSSQVPPTLSFRAGPLNIGVVHGWGARHDLGARVAHALGEKYDIVLFGHAHKREWTDYGHVKVLNPGSLQEFDDKASFAYLNIDEDGTAVPEFVLVNEK